MDTSNLAKRMKEYEKASQHYLTRRMPVILRLDGIHFHNFTRGLHRPFDNIFMMAMHETTKYLCENIQGCVFGYTQSDEITLILIDYKKLTSDAWYDNRQNKIESAAASLATVKFNKEFERIVESDIYKAGEKEVYQNAINKLPCFDCRAFNIPVDDVVNNIYWRQLDATRNSIQMLGQANFSHNELQNKSCNQIQDLLMVRKGINWNNLSIYKKRGTAVIRNNMLYGRYSEKKCLDIPESSWIIDKEMPQLKGEDREYINRLIYISEEKEC